MKSVYAIGFTLLYIAAMIRPIAPLAEYLVNQDYIAEFLCINKEKVELQCNGKCYLMQQLKKQNEEKRKNLPPIYMEEYPIGFVTLVLFIPKDNIPSLSSRPKPTYQNRYDFLYSWQDFHPPSFSV